MEKIITDIEQLHQVSEETNNITEQMEIVDKLISSAPANALGLAAPQINIKKRIFLANLNLGSYIFINPKIIRTSSEQIVSTEGCLSIPDCQVSVSRFSRVEIEAEVIKCPSINLGTQRMHLYGLDACIVQHEMDHLNGVLITDRPVAKTDKEKKIHESSDRNDRIKAQRKAKKILKQKQHPQASKKLTPKDIQKEKKRRYKERKRFRKAVRLIELNRIKNDNLIQVREKTDNEQE